MLYIQHYIKTVHVI